jgi:hypothetical protein
MSEPVLQTLASAKRDLGAFQVRRMRPANTSDTASPEGS